MRLGKVVAAEPPSGSDTFAAGQRVRHPTFGEGVVLSVSPLGNDWELTVVFSSHGIKRLLAGYARLEKVKE